MTNKLYALHPGRIPAKEGNGHHYISFIDLIGLYQLEPGEYVLWRRRGMLWSDYHHLFPSFEGHYGRPKAKASTAQR